MTLIDKYVYTVTKFLPEKTRADVEKELRSNIMDMLPQGYTEADAEKALYALGNPAVLAEEYREGKRHLISPALYGNYIRILKLVAIIVGCIVPFAAFIVALEGSHAVGWGLLLHTFLQTLVIGINAAVHVFAWVTVVFAALERGGAAAEIKWPYTGKEWTVKDLQEPLDHQHPQISKGEPIATIVFTIVTTALVCFFPQILGWYSRPGGGWSVIPLFDMDVLSVYIPFILAVSAMGIFAAVLMLVYKRWNTKLAAINALHCAMVVALSAAMLFNRNLLNGEFRDAFIEGVSNAQHSGEELGLWIIALTMAGIAATCAWSAFSGYRRAKK